jgi:hypothetical protein
MSTTATTYTTGATPMSELRSISRCSAVKLSLLSAANDRTDKGARHAWNLIDRDFGTQLLSQLADQKFDLTSGALRDNILRFYSDLSVQIETNKDGVRWQAVLAELDQLKAVASTVASSPAQ